MRKKTLKWRFFIHKANTYGLKEIINEIYIEQIFPEKILTRNCIVLLSIFLYIG